jgi:hypothetical protein
MLGSTLIGMVTFAVGLAIVWYGLSSIARSFLAPQTTKRRILQIAMFALVVGAFVSGANRPLEGIVGVLSVLVFWFPLARFRPASRWATWLRNAAYSAIVVYAGSLYVGMRSAQALTTRGCFWVVRLPFGDWVHFPPPYDGYVRLVTIYIFLVSLILTVVCLAACLCVWSFGKLGVKGLALAKLPSR